MPTNKNAQLRYKILDRCFSNFKHKYTIDELVDEVNESLSDLTGQDISLRQIRDDIKYMRDRVSYNAPIKAYPFGSGRQCYYRYEDPNFSIFDNELSAEELNDLRSTIEMLGKFRGSPANAWLEEVISNLEYRFNIKPNTENLIAFENNEQLKGLEYLSDIIDMTIHHQPVNIHYCSFKGKEQDAIIHPYYVKQYNNRWFVLGYNEKYQSLSIYALDRIQSLKKADITFQRMRTLTSWLTLMISLVLLFLMRKHLKKLLCCVSKQTDFHTFCQNHFILLKKLSIWIIMSFPSR